MYRVAYYMNIGARSSQEDCLFVNGAVFQQDRFEKVSLKSIREETALFAVCDGMGGHSKGEWASRFVCERLKDFKEQTGPAGLSVELLLKKIQKRIESETVINSGTTIAGVSLEQTRGTIFNAGDSRVYKITKEDIIYISHDHSWVQSNVDMGNISEAEAFGHPYRNLIEFGIGDVFRKDWTEGTRKVYVTDDMLGPGESYLICSDGLNDALRDEDIFSALHPDPFNGSNELAELATKTVRDNISFILVGRG